MPTQRVSINGIIYLRDENGKMTKSNKKKGVDNKACWEGYRYGGTKNGKDVCVKVKK